MPLRRIAATIDSPGFDRRAALYDQLELLRLRKERLEGLIAFTESMIKGGTGMDFTAFDGSKEKQYAEEAKKRWGGTDAYGEFEKKKPGAAAAEGLTELFTEFGKLKKLPADGPEARGCAAKLKAYISENYYTCTDEILFGLGQMYVSDPRFKENIDAAGGEGTAEFVSKAIAHFCGK